MPILSIDHNGVKGKFTWQYRDVTPLTVFGVAEIETSDGIYTTDVVVSRYLLENRESLAGKVILQIVTDRIARDFAVMKKA